MNHRKPRYFGAAQKTNFVSFCIGSIRAVVKNDKGCSYQARVPMIRSYFLKTQNDNSLGVKMDANPFVAKATTYLKRNLVSLYHSPISFRSRTEVIPNEDGAGKGSRKKRILCCNGRDRSCDLFLM